jgi:hypothetical protein
MAQETKQHFKPSQEMEHHLGAFHYEIISESRSIFLCHAREKRYT